MFLIILCLVSLVEYSPVGSGNRTGQYDCTPGGQHPLSGSGTSGQLTLVWRDRYRYAVCSCRRLWDPHWLLCGFPFRVLAVLLHSETASAGWQHCYLMASFNLSRLISSRNVGPGSIVVAAPPAKDDSYFFSPFLLSTYILIRRILLTLSGEG